MNHHYQNQNQAHNTNLIYDPWNAIDKWHCNVHLFILKAFIRNPQVWLTIRCEEASFAIRRSKRSKKNYLHFHAEIPFMATKYTWFIAYGLSVVVISKRQGHSDKRVSVYDSTRITCVCVIMLVYCAIQNYIHYTTNIALVQSDIKKIISEIDATWLIKLRLHAAQMTHR